MAKITTTTTPANPAPAAPATAAAAGSTAPASAAVAPIDQEAREQLAKDREELERQRSLLAREREDFEEYKRVTLLSFEEKGREQMTRPRVGTVRVRVIGQAVAEDHGRYAKGEEFETTATRAEALGALVEVIDDES